MDFTPFAEDNTFERTATVEYSTDDGDSWVTEVPAIAAIGEHAIQYRVVVAGIVKKSGNCDISISKMGDEEKTLKLGTEVTELITCTGAFDTDEWTVTTDTDGYEDYFTLDKTEGVGKTFQVTVTTKGELTVKPIWVTIACDSVTYRYKITVGAAGEEGKINLAYGGAGMADEVKVSENSYSDATTVQTRYYKATLTGDGVTIDTQDPTSQAVRYKEWTLTATKTNGAAQVTFEKSGSQSSGYSLMHTDDIVTMGKRVAYVGKKLTAYCWSIRANEWTFTSDNPTIATVSGDTTSGTEAYLSITGVKPGKTFITASNVKSSGSGTSLTQNGYEYKLWVEVREQPVLVDGTLTTTPITVGEALSKSTITGTMVNSDEMQVDGTFVWADDTIQPTLADSEKTQYFVIFKPWDASYDEVRLVATVKVERIPVDVPTAQSSFTYDGNAKIGVVGGDGYTLGGVVVATNAGTYTATAELGGNYAWADDKTTTNKFITWMIAAKEVEVTAEDQSMLVGGTLPELTYKITNGELVGDDELVGTLCTTDTLTVGTHDIVQANDWVNPNYDVTFVKGTLTVGAGKVTVNGKGYDNVAAAMDDVTSNGGTAVFNEEVGYAPYTFPSSTTLTVADGAWFVTNDLTLAATTVTNDISVSEKLTLAGNVTVGSDDAEAVLAFGSIDVGGYKLTLSTNGVVRSATQLDDAVFAEVEHFHVAKKTIADAFEYTLEATEFYVKYYDGDEVVHSNKFTILNYMTDLKVWDGTREGLVLVGYTREDKTTELAVTDDALRAYVADEAAAAGCDGEVKVFGTWEPEVTPVDVPSAVTGLIYDGTEQTGVVAKTGFTLTGNAKTTAGEYTAEAKLADGYCWADDSTTNKFITWSIAAKAITVTACDTNMLVKCETPEFKYKVTSGELVGDDELVGTLCTTDTLTVGTHDIVQANDWVNPNYDVTFVKGTLTVGAGKVTVNGKGYDNVAAAMDDVTSNGGTAVFNGDETFKVFTFEKDTTLTVADGAWFVTNNLTLAATTVTNDISVSEKLTLAGNVTVGSDDAEAVLAFGSIDVGEFKLTLSTNGVVRSATQLDDAVFTAAPEGYEITETEIDGGFEYKLAAFTYFNITIVKEDCVTDVQTGGVSVVGTLALVEGTTEVELTLVSTNTIPVFKFKKNDGDWVVTNKTPVIAVEADDVLCFKSEEAKIDDPEVTAEEAKQAIIDAIDEENKEAVAPKIEAVVDTSDTPAEDKVSAAEMATWITENEIKSADMAQSDFLVASVKLDAVAPITAEDPISVNNSSGTVDQVGIETSIEIAGTPVKEANAVVSVTGIGTNGEEVAVSLDYDEDTGRAQITPNDSKVDSFVATLSVKSDDGTKSIETKIGYLTKPAYKSDTAESKYARELVAVPWASLSDGAAISVADFLVTDNLAAKTKLYSYDRENDRYNAWELSEAKVWEPINTIVIGKGGIETSGSKTAEDAKIAYGEAVWVERADASTPLVFIGDAGEKNLPTSVKMEKGYNFVSFPNIKTDLFRLNRIKNPGAKDFILVPQASGSPRQYTLKDGVWGYDQYQKVGKVTKKIRATDDAISKGSGFEYVRDVSTTVDPVVPLVEEEETEEETK